MALGPSLHIASESSVLVSWSAVPGAEKYGVIVHDGKGKYVDWPTKSLREEGKDARPGSDPCVFVEGLQPGVAYKAKVASKHGDTWSDYSAFSAVVKLGMVPGAPLLEPVNSSMLVVSWPAVPDARMYDVMVHDGAVKYVNWQDNSLQLNAQNTNAGTATSIVVKGLKPGVPYKARVAARLGDTWSQFSNYSDVVELGTGVDARERQSNKRHREHNCAVCWSKAPEVAFDPCGHVCACRQCAASLTSCPLCRGNISKRLRIYGL